MDNVYWKIFAFVALASVGVILISNLPQQSQREFVAPVMSEYSPTASILPRSPPADTADKRPSITTSKLSGQNHPSNTPQPNDRLVIGEFMDPDEQPPPQGGNSGEQVVLGGYIDPDEDTPNRDWNGERLVIGQHIDPEDATPYYENDQERIVIGVPIDPENTETINSAGNEQIVLGKALDPER